jgi:hypothetical protein
MTVAKGSGRRDRPKQAEADVPPNRHPVVTRQRPPKVLCSDLSLDCRDGSWIEKPANGDGS